MFVNDIDADELEATRERDRRHRVGRRPDRCGACPTCWLRRAVEQRGALDIVVNNAGYIWNSALHNHSDEQWDAMLDIHVTAPFRILRAYGRWLRDRTSVRRRDAVPQGGQRLVGVRAVRRRDAGRVLRRQGRAGRPDAHAREGMGTLQRHRERRRVRPHRNATDAGIRRRTAAHRRRRTQLSRRPQPRPGRTADSR